ncbi:unnamed protein product, partial [marine sediment metagenome]
SLIPAYRESPDNIIGVLHTKDFTRSLIEKKNYSLQNLIRPAYFIPETKLISEVLKEMQRRGERLAVVTDEYGGTEGLITVEDILEEIVGEIKDKTKKEIKEYTKLPDDKYYVLGSMSIDDFNETFSFALPESDEYNTIAGFIALNSGKILNTGESYEFEGLKFELIKKIRQKMVQFVFLYFKYCSNTLWSFSIRNFIKVYRFEYRNFKIPAFQVFNKLIFFRRKFICNKNYLAVKFAFNSFVNRFLSFNN